jgi:hypothetical protein
MDDALCQQCGRVVRAEAADELHVFDCPWCRRHKPGAQTRVMLKRGPTAHFAHFPGAPANCPRRVDAHEEGGDQHISVSRAQDALQALCPLEQQVLRPDLVEQLLPAVLAGACAAWTQDGGVGTVLQLLRRADFAKALRRWIGVMAARLQPSELTPISLARAIAAQVESQVSQVRNLPGALQPLLAGWQPAPLPDNAVTLNLGQAPRSLWHVEPNRKRWQVRECTVGGHHTSLRIQAMAEQDNNAPGAIWKWSPRGLSARGCDLTQLQMELDPQEAVVLTVAFGRVSDRPALLYVFPQDCEGAANAPIELKLEYSPTVEVRSAAARGVDADRYQIWFRNRALPRSFTFDETIEWLEHISLDDMHLVQIRPPGGYLRIVREVFPALLDIRQQISDLYDAGFR